MNENSNEFFINCWKYFSVCLHFQTPNVLKNHPLEIQTKYEDNKFKIFIL